MEPIIAALLPETQVPPDMESDNAVVTPAQTAGVPAGGGGIGFIVTNVVT